MKRRRDPLCAVIGANVKAAREGRNMSLRDVAELTGTSPGYWSRVERGTSEMGVCRAVLVSHVLGATMDQLTRPPNARLQVTRTKAERVSRAIGRRLRYPEWYLGVAVTPDAVNGYVLDVRVERGHNPSVSVLPDRIDGVKIRRVERTMAKPLKHVAKPLSAAQMTAAIGLPKMTRMQVDRVLGIRAGRIKTGGPR